MVCQRYANRERMFAVTFNKVSICQAAKTAAATEVGGEVKAAEKGSVNIETSSKSDGAIAELRQNGSTEINATVRHHFLIWLIYPQIISQGGVVALGGDLTRWKDR
jgi:hypothetical protein